MNYYPMLLTVEWLRSRPADKYEICGYTMELNCIGQKLSLIFTPLYLLIMMWRGQLMLTAVELSPWPGYFRELDLDS